MSRLDSKKVIVFIVVLVTLVQLALAGIAFLWRRAEGDAVATARAEILSLQQQLDDARSQSAAKEAPSAEERSWRLLAGPDVVPTLQRLRRLGDQAGISLDSQKALRTSEANRQSFTVLGRGKPLEVCKFLAAIEQDPRLMIVETGRLLPSTEDRIAFELGVATYHREAR